jgi:hypothetical protein
VSHAKPSLSLAQSITNLILGVPHLHIISDDMSSFHYHPRRRLSPHPQLNEVVKVFWKSTHFWMCDQCQTITIVSMIDHQTYGSSNIFTSDQMIYSSFHRYPWWRPSPHTRLQEAVMAFWKSSHFWVCEPCKTFTLPSTIDHKPDSGHPTSSHHIRRYILIP